MDMVLSKHGLVQKVTDRQKAMHMSPPYNLHRWAQLNILLARSLPLPSFQQRSGLAGGDAKTDISSTIFFLRVCYIANQ